MKKILFFIALVQVLALNNAFAQKTFVPTTGNWHVAGNWSPSGIPATSNNVIIPAGKTCNIAALVTTTGGISVNGTLTNSNTFAMSAGGLSVFSGGVFTNNSGGVVTIAKDCANGLSVWSGGVVNNAGSFTIASGIPGTDASYCDMSGTINNTGTFSNGIYMGAFENTGARTFNSSRYTNPSGAITGYEGTVECIYFTAGFTNNGTLHFDLAPGGPCVGSDQIVVTGASAVLGGTFTATGSTNGTYAVVTAPSITGFTNTTVNLGGGKYAHFRQSGGTLNAIVNTLVVLGIELLSFDVNTEGGKNNLAWTTASEVNNSHYDIERSTDGNTFHSIGQVKGNNKPSSYQFVDNQPFATSYYRLRQIDFDGTETVSKVVSVEQKGKGKGLKAYPNPVSNTLTIESTEGGYFQILNLLGQQVLTGKTPPSGVGGLDMSALPQGSYVLKVGTEQAKFIKQ
jgi:hypothetical protein